MSTQPSNIISGVCDCA